MFHLIVISHISSSSGLNWGLSTTSPRISTVGSSPLLSTLAAYRNVSLVL